MELVPQKAKEEKNGFLNFPNLAEVKKVVELKSLNYKPTMYKLLCIDYRIYQSKICKSCKKLVASKIFKFLNQRFARLRCWKKCLEITRPTCGINSCLAGDTFLKPKSCKTLI